MLWTALVLQCSSRDSDMGHLSTPHWFSPRFMYTCMCIYHIPTTCLASCILGRSSITGFSRGRLGTPLFGLQSKTQHHQYTLICVNSLLWQLEFRTATRIQSCSTKSQNMFMDLSSYVTLCHYVCVYMYICIYVYMYMDMQIQFSVHRQV